jgi:hypothetical protein
MVMEYVSGDTLERVIQQQGVMDWQHWSGRIPAKRACSSYAFFFPVQRRRPARFWKSPMPRRSGIYVSPAPGYSARCPVRNLARVHARSRNSFTVVPARGCGATRTGAKRRGVFIVNLAPLKGARRPETHPCAFGRVSQPGFLVGILQMRTMDMPTG